MHANAYILFFSKFCAMLNIELRSATSKFYSKFLFNILRKYNYDLQKKIHHNHIDTHHYKQKMMYTLGFIYPFLKLF